MSLWLEPSSPVGLPNLFPQRGTILTPTTWANRPAANTVPAGTILPITGFDSLVYCVADPTNNQWKPLGGNQALYHRSGSVAANGIAREQGTGTARSIVLPSGLGLIPGGMLFVGSRVEARARMNKESTETGQVHVVLAASATPNAVTNQFGHSGAANAANPAALNVAAAADIVDANTFVRFTASTPGPWSSGSGAAAYSDLTFTSITTTDSYVGLVMSSTFTSAAFISVLSFDVSWLG